MDGLRLDVSGFTAVLTHLANNDIRTAGAWALNDTAADVLLHTRRRIAVAFDNPTLFTQNAFMVVRADAGSLEAAVQEKPSGAKRHFLKMQETGGPRPMRGFENQLARSLAYEGVIQSVMPADNARLDAYGNWSNGERVQVQSALGAQRDATANTTATSKKRRKRRATYFVPNQWLTPGIYKREVGSRDISMVAFISDKVPVYHQRLGFFEGAGQVWRDRLPDHLARTLSKVFAKSLRKLG